MRQPRCAIHELVHCNLRPGRSTLFARLAMRSAHHATLYLLTLHREPREALTL